MENQNIFSLEPGAQEAIRYIRLEKKASYREHNVNSSSKSYEKQWESTTLYTFGFYDSLTCYAPAEMTSDYYRKHFLVSYPFEKNRETVRVEQWFCLLPLNERKRYNTINQKVYDDPFFCTFCGEQDKAFQKEDYPFVGVILISLGNDHLSNNKSEEKKNSTFDEILEDFVEQTNEKIFCVDKREKYISEIYYSLNCADLCLVIRTDVLPLIHTINSDLNRIAGECGYKINTTVIFSIEKDANINAIKQKQKNKLVSFIVRSNEECPSSMQKSSYGVNGVGKYVTQLSFEEYVNLFPAVPQAKWEEDLSKDLDPAMLAFIRSICHEREWFEENSGESDNVEQLETPMPTWINELHDKLEEIEQKLIAYFASETKSDSADGESIASTAEINRISSAEFQKNIYRDSFLKEFSLLKELIYTYSDLLYQNASESGVAFFAQMTVVLQALELYTDALTEKNDDDIRKPIKELIQIMHTLVCDLNGYNKQFQFLNQDSVNFPSYEIRSKVNSEKYMAAYCSFLHRFFANVANGNRWEENKYSAVKFYPIALVDINQEKIIANLIFSDMFTKDNIFSKRALFSLHFPNSEYFVNLNNSIPLLAHEIGHAYTTKDISRRNHSLLYNINSYFAETIGEQFLLAVNNGILIKNSSLLPNQLITVVKDSVEELQKESKNDPLALHGAKNISALLDACKAFYGEIIDKHNQTKRLTFMDKKELAKRTKASVEHLLQLVGFDTVYSILNAENEAEYSTVYYLFAVLLLLFNQGFAKEKNLARKLSKTIEDKINELSADEQSKMIKEKINELFADEQSKMIKEKINELFADEQSKMIEEILNALFADEQSKTIEEKLNALFANEQSKTIEEKLNALFANEQSKTIEEKINELFTDEQIKMIEEKLNELFADEQSKTIEEKLNELSTVELRMQDDHISEKLLTASLTLLRQYTKGVAPDSETEVSEKKEQIDSLDILFFAMLNVTLLSIWIKYGDNFPFPADKIIYCKSLYRDNRLYSNIDAFAGQLEQLYRVFIVTGKRSALDKKKMEAMLSEYFEGYVCVNNIVKYLENINDIPDGNENPAEAFVKRMHRKQRAWINALEEEESFNGHFFILQNREQLIRLGYFEETAENEEEIAENEEGTTKEKEAVTETKEELPEITSAVFSAVVSELPDNFVNDFIEERAEVFNEAYADCSMCAVMDFDAFGYCRFAIPTYTIVAQKNASAAEARFLADRIKAILIMLLCDEAGKLRLDKYTAFLAKLADAEMIASIIDSINFLKNDFEAQELKKVALSQKSDYKQRKSIAAGDIQYQDYRLLSRWRDRVVSRLIPRIVAAEKQEQFLAEHDRLHVAKKYCMDIASMIDFLVEEDILIYLEADDFQQYFQYLHREMRENQGILRLRKDSCVEHIGRLYNIQWDEAEPECDKFNWYYNALCESFIKQCNFIFSYYCDYRTAFSRIGAESTADNPLPMEQWLDVIDQYYQSGEET